MQSEYFPQNNRRLRNLVLGFILCGVIAVAGFIYWYAYASKKVVSLHPKSNTTITFGTVNEQQNSIQDELIRTTSVVSLRVRPGIYIAVFSASGFDQKTQKITVDANTTIDTPDLSYSAQKLSSDLTQQSGVIKAVALADPLVAGYKVSYEKLFLSGEWYAAILAPPDPTKSDIYRVILKKQDGRWQVAAGPKFVFYIGDFPDIPQEVIRDVNNH